MTSFRAITGGFEMIPPAWAADRPRVTTANARSWADLADLCAEQASWCAMALETRQIEPHERAMIRMEHGQMIEAVAAYRHWAALRRPFRGRPAQ